MDGIFGKVKGIPMPLEGLFRLSKRCQERITLSIFGRRHIVPADLFFSIWIHVGSECFGNQLSTETNTQHGEASLHDGDRSSHSASEIRHFSARDSKYREFRGERAERREVFS